MNDSARPRPLTPCFFTGRLVEGSEIELVSVTRIGATAAQLSGRCPVPGGEPPSQLTREQATRLALGAMDPDAGRALRASMNADGALPAMYVAPPGGGMRLPLRGPRRRPTNRRRPRANRGCWPTHPLPTRRRAATGPAWCRTSAAAGCS